MYKKKDVCVSELDVVGTSQQLACDIVVFLVHQTANIHSDHVIVTLEMRLLSVNLFVLNQLASILDDHSSLMGGKDGTEVVLKL